MTEQTPSIDHLKVPLEKLRWNCDESQFEFETTAEIEPTLGVLGQSDAVEALRFGLEFKAPGQNIFVRGLTGTGRLTLVYRLLEQIQPESAAPPDLCYAHDFDHPDSPRLIVMPRGSGARFRDRMDELADFTREKLGPSLSSEEIRKRQTELDEKLQEDMQEFGKPFEDELHENGLTIVQAQMGQTSQPVVLPLIENEPAPPERIQQLVREGKLTEEQVNELDDKLKEYSRQFQEVSQKIGELREKHREAVRDLYEQRARSILEDTMRDITRDFPQPEVGEFLGEIIEDVIRRQMSGQEEVAEGDRLYRVNLILGHDEDEPCPIVVENTPTMVNLLGTIDRKVLPNGMVQSDHLMIGAGSLLRANGGYLIMEARDVLVEPGAWKVLMRSLRTGKLEIAPHDSAFFGVGSRLKPEPINIDAKVVLLGGPELYYTLDALDPDFSNQFKILADFDSAIERDKMALGYYAGSLSRISEEGNLLPFARSGVAALAEYGVRIAGRRQRLTARFGRLADIAREAAYIAGKREAESVERSDVHDAVARSRHRSDLPARKFREAVNEGSIHIQVEGRVIGQLNGLAVTRSGPLTYGFPARITATIGPGSAGAINIEREAQLSGAIHTKGFYILGGLLRHLLNTDHPLAFSASIAFEQSYGGIDGDSASGAEMCCLLSALTDTPLRQDLAMTGAIDQHGRIQAIGAVSEKIEGFFDTCNAHGLTGSQGVIIPRTNLEDIMLRRQVADACARGEFHVYAVSTIQEALEVFTGAEAGEMDEEGYYPEGSLLNRAVTMAREFWMMARGTNNSAQEEEEEENGKEVEKGKAAK